MTARSVTDLLLEFFELLCTCLQSTQPTDTGSVKGQQEKDILAMEIVMLFRLLLSIPEGSLARDCVQKLLTDVIEDKYKPSEKAELKVTKPKSAELSPRSEEGSNKIRLLAVLYILGGQRDVLRVGGKVLLPARYGNYGVVQAHKTSSYLAKIGIESEGGVIESRDFALSEFQKVDEVIFFFWQFPDLFQIPFEPSMFEVTPELLSSLASIIVSPPPSEEASSNSRTSRMKEVQDLHLQAWYILL